MGDLAGERGSEVSPSFPTGGDSGDPNSVHWGDRDFMRMVDIFRSAGADVESNAQRVGNVTQRVVTVSWRTHSSDLSDVL